MLTAQTINEVVGDRDRVADALTAAHDVAQTACPPALLALCERRIASLLGAAVPTADHSDLELDPDLERSALAFVEQWVIDVASITDGMVAGLTTHLSEDGLMDFVHGLLVVEQRIRLGLAWDRLGLASLGLAS